MNEPDASPTPPAKRPPEPQLQRLRRLVRLLDDWVRVPGTEIRIGLDPLIGLVPGLGDVLATWLSGYVVVEAARLGAPWPVIVRMLGNLGIDALVGSAPLLGDLFDVGWKANRRNLALLEEHRMAPHEARRSSILALTIAVGGVVGLLVGVVGLVVLVFRLLLGG